MTTATSPAPDVDVDLAESRIYNADLAPVALERRKWRVGQALGLPLTMALYSFIGVGVTLVTTIVYGETIWDPVDILTRFRNPVILVVALISLCVATLATNIAANIVSPANDFSNLSPRKISFRLGGLITGIIGVVMMPWKLVADSSGYLFTWLVGLQRAPWPDRRDHDRRLLCLSS